MKLGNLTPVVISCVLLASCSKVSMPSVLGHWQAERETFFSAHLPVGPDIVISSSAVSVPDTDASVPLTAIRLKDNEVVLEMPYGVGVSFYFDGPNRMYLKVPVVGRVYYQRVVDAVIAAPHVVAKKAGTPLTKVGEPSAIPVVLVSSPASSAIPGESGADSAKDNANLAIRAAGRGDNDRALDYMRKALALGFRGFAKFDNAPELASLRADVRYQALVGRYR